jgi:hypothetical protein
VPIRAAGAKTPTENAQQIVIDEERRTDRLGCPINHNVGEQFVLGEALFHVAVAVAQPLKLFDEPGRESGRGIVQAVRQRLWARRLDHVVRPLLPLKLFVPLK